MLSAGKNIQSSSDKLQKVSIDYLYHSIKNPKPEIIAKIKQLRIIRDLDSKRYSYLKRQLPYIVCGAFSPPFRRLENFVYIEHFIIDLDHLSEKGISPIELKEKLKKDPRLVLMFLSPGEDGLKLLYNLKERCRDAGIYSLFYRKFVNSLALEYNLQQVVDKVTSDASRACFISMDDEVYYNPQAEGVNLEDFLNLEDTFALFEENKQENRQRKQEQQIEKQENKLPKDPDNDTLSQIKQVLGAKTRIKKEKNVFVPEQLNEIITGLKEYIEQNNIVVYEIINIQYAKKIRCRLSNQKGEINLFYGKKGFSIVQSPSCGTSAEFNEVLAQIIEFYLEENT
ncbi:MAG: CRISPR-associated primase-polymerase type B [Bacteroidota bacterium]|nr:CRISPR-associated primase-polymerase type B [Bacteroidota bacterium]